MASLTRADILLDNIYFIYGGEPLASLNGRLNPSGHKHFFRNLNPRPAKTIEGCWRLAFAGHSHGWEGALATLMHTRSAGKSPGGDTQGIVIELTQNQLLIMDDYFGSNGKHAIYRREYIVVGVYTPHKGYIKAMAQTWILNDVKFKSMPSPQYLCSIFSMLRDRQQLIKNEDRRCEDDVFTGLSIYDCRLRKRRKNPYILDHKQVTLKELAVLMNSVAGSKLNWKIPEDIRGFTAPCKVIGVTNSEQLRALLVKQCDPQIISLLRHASQPAFSLQTLRVVRLLLSTNEA